MLSIKTFILSAQLVHAALILILQTARAHTTALLREDVLSSLGPHLTVPHLTGLHSHHVLPARQGANFEGPDPGLNAAIISAPEICPNNYKVSPDGRCRPAFTYGPNPLSTFSPEKFKGSIQYYMGLRIGSRPSQHTRRRPWPRQRVRGGAGARHRPRPRPRGNRLHMSTTPRSTPLPPLQSTPPPPPYSLLPTPPPLTQPVAEITAILEMLQNDPPELEQDLDFQVTETQATDGQVNEAQLADGQHIDDDDD